MPYNWNKIVLLRLYAWELIKDRDKVLYLDADTLVVGKLDELWNMELGDAYFGIRTQPLGSLSPMCKNGFINYLIKGKRTDIHVNAGVILFNLKKLRQDNPEWKQYYSKNYMRLVLNDQHLICALWADKLVPISSEWNYLIDHPLGHFNRDDNPKPRILHFLWKPWTVNVPYHEIYLKYCNLPECSCLRSKVRKHLNAVDVWQWPPSDAVIDAWLMFEMEKSDYFERFFRDRGYKTAAVYGIGRMGRLFTYKNTKAEAVNVKYYIDNKDEHMFFGKPVIRPEPKAIFDFGENEVDVIIVTPVNCFMEIETCLKDIYGQKANIVSIVEIVFY